MLGVEDKGDLYSIKLSATRQGVPAQNVTFYATKAGKLILGQDLVDLTEEISTTTTPVSIGQIKTPSMDDDAVLGSEDAPVTIIEFSDYQCPFCNRHYVQTLPQLKAEYINTGKVKLVFRDFPLTFHTEADEAAEAAECAGEQGKYWEMHDKLFESVDEWGGKSDPKDVFKNLASDIGLDSTDFNECLDSGKYTQEVQEDEQDGASLGITGTPGFFLITPKEHVNGDDLATLNQLASSRGRGIEIFEDSEEGNIIVKLGGALPFSDFKTAIDALLP